MAGKCVDVGRYKELFKEADKNGDGTLSEQEIRGLFQSGGSMTDQQITDTFTFFEGPDGDKKITYSEFEKGLDVIMVFVQELKKLFDQMDKSKDGFLSRDELKSVLQSSKQKFSEEEITEILKSADTNGDNKISFEEFVSSCT